MATGVEIIKRAYRTLLPASVRRSRMVAKLKWHLLGHDWIYNADYYERAVEGPAARSAGRIADSILADFSATRIIDVGCGTGALLAALRDRGCVVHGLEYSEAALRYCRARRLSVAKFDLERDVLGDHYTFDVAVSMEVAEHLPAAIADRYIDLLVSLSRAIVFTAAPPGQGGADHVNEQPPSYWIDKFKRRGFSHTEGLSRRWCDAWLASGEVESWYCQNLMIFQAQAPPSPTR